MNFKAKSIILLFVVCFQSLSSSINEKVCGDIQIENETLSDLDKFSDCTIIGMLSLSRIESLDPFLQINNISFSHLREISGWLSIREVGELISLKHLFPELSVIRGRNYKQVGLQLYSNNDLEEIGLNNLKQIGGAIHIHHNPKLCFVNTINWKELMSNPDDTLNIMRNNDNCPSCSNSKFCWNEEDSQAICDSSCLSGVCERDGTCCDSQCLAGCSSDPNDCEICRHVSFNGTCVRECIENTFLFKDGSCVTSEECETKNSMLEEDEIRMKVYDGECRNDCPNRLNMVIFGGSNSSFDCFGYKMIVCDGDLVINDTTIYWDMEEINCEIVTGFVEINLSVDVCEDENLLRKLQKIFSSLEEIYKYLKITGTSIRHLGFLTSLKRIRGIELESEKYSLILQNNKNLRKIWLPSQNVSLDRGETKLQGNPKFCRDEKCEDVPIELEIEVFTYAAKVKWNPTKSLSNNLTYTIWNADEFNKIKQSFCSTENAKLIEEEIPGVQKIYGLRAGTRYVYQMFDGKLQNQIGSPKYFSTLSSFIEIMQTSVGPSTMTFHWHNLTYSQSSTVDQIVRLELKAFRIPPDYEFYEEQNYCNRPTYNSPRYYSDKNTIDIADINRMRDDIKELFQRELLNERISNISIGQDFIYKEVQGAATSFTFDDVDHFSEYFVSIRTCYQFQELDCSKLKIFSIYTTDNKEADHIENFTAEVVHSNAVELKWESPKHPNGLVLTFTVFFGIVGSKQTNILCIIYKQFVEREGKKLIKNLAPGKYEFSVVARSLAGNGRQSDPIFLEIKAVNVETESNYLMYWIISSIASILLFIAILIIFRKRSTRRKYFATFQSKPEDLPEDDFELERENIELLNELGSGQFGLVYEGIFRHQEENKLSVAVKTVNNEASLEDSINFLKEAEIMKNFKTFHVIKLLGIVSKSKPYFVVMELMTNGDLKTYLRKNRPLATQSGNYSSPPLKSTVPPVSHMAIQIADGMAYLSHKKFVHRDLASRNCMVSADLTVKIGDFGLTRDIYEADYYRRRRDCLMPVRWMSPENLKDGIFSSESDVFSYGIVLWEIVTYAEQPYKGKSNDQVFTFIIEGGTESRPDENCSDSIYEIMTKCWRILPEKRISFIEIIEELLSKVPKNFIEQSFYCLRD